MKVSEIEGDAVLFYKTDVPSADALLAQAETTFLAFHEHLKKYQRDRICNCGACSNAQGLTLKIIAHAAHIEMIKVKETEKPYGPGVITAHRLLKNDVPAREYVLITESALNESATAQQSEWVTLENGHNEYSEIGVVNYQYSLMTPLHERVKLAPPLPLPPKVKQPVTGETIINISKEVLFQIVLNFDVRSKWNSQAKEVRYEPNKINRVGTKHLCVFDSGDIEFETITNKFGEDKLVYGERLLTKPFMLKDMVIYSIVSDAGPGQSLLRMEAHPIFIPGIKWFLGPVFKKKFEANIKTALGELRELAEKNPEGISEA